MGAAALPSAFALGISVLGFWRWHLIVTGREGELQESSGKESNSELKQLVQLVKLFTKTCQKLIF